MNPKLVCRIEVRTASGDEYIGSGYPIMPDRIITAAHVVTHAASNENYATEGNARQITLFFGSREEKIDTPVFLEWCGQGCGVDVAVLKCELPESLHPTHRLLIAPPKTPIGWFAQGYTDFGDEKRPGGKDAYEGRLTVLSDDESTVPLECWGGLLDSKQWASGSGSLAFDSKTARTALAVITRYQSGKMDDQLVAVPMCYLLNASVTRDTFRAAIRFDAYQQGPKQPEDHYKRVVEAVESALRDLDRDGRITVAQEMIELVGEVVSGIDLKVNDETLIEQTASFIVDYKDITGVIGSLIYLMPKMSQDGKEKVADIIDNILPLNYAPNAIHYLRKQVDDDHFGLLEDEVTTRALAEIIMAGYDEQPAKFAALTDENGHVRGVAALDYQSGPEVGPSEPGAEMMGVMRGAKTLLYDLLALLDATPQTTPDISPDVIRVVDDYASRLQGVLRSRRNILRRRRTMYCVLKLPDELGKRHFRKQVIREVCNRVSQLVFVELVPFQKDERESEIADSIGYIQKHIRFIRT